MRWLTTVEVDERKKRHLHEHSGAGMFIIAKRNANKNWTKGKKGAAQRTECRIYDFTYQ